MRFFKRSDILVVIIILVVSGVSWLIYSNLFSEKTVKAEIYLNSELVMTVNLQSGAEKTFSIPGKENVVFHLDKEGNIRFEKSNCPDQICVNTGKLHIVGQSAACLPNGIVMNIVPAGRRSEDDIDIVR